MFYYNLQMKKNVSYPNGQVAEGYFFKKKKIYKRWFL